MQAAPAEQLFTLFLANPVLAFVRLSGCTPTASVLSKLEERVDDAHQHLQSCVAPQHGASERGSGEDDGLAWTAALADPFAGRLIVRFALCRAVLAWLACDGRGDGISVSGEPVAHPSLPSALSADDDRLHELVAAIWQEVDSENGL